MVYVSVVTSAFLLIDYETNSYTRIITAPITKRRYLFENLLSYLTIAIIQILMTVIVFAFGLKILYFGSHGLLLILLFCMFAVTITAFGLIVVTIVKSEKVSYWVIMFITTPLVMLGGCYFDISGMSIAIQRISKFLPTTWMMDGARDLIKYNDASSIHENFLILLTFAVTFFIISNITIKRLTKA
jgi:ABC-2 type transport system permease protein